MESTNERRRRLARGSLAMGGSLPTRKFDMACYRVDDGTGFQQPGFRALSGSDAFLYVQGQYEGGYVE